MRAKELKALLNDTDTVKYSCPFVHGIEVDDVDCETSKNCRECWEICVEKALKECEE